MGTARTLPILIEWGRGVLAEIPRFCVRIIVKWHYKTGTAFFESEIYYMSPAQVSTVIIVNSTLNIMPPAQMTGP